MGKYMLNEESRAYDKMHLEGKIIDLHKKLRKAQISCVKDLPRISDSEVIDCVDDLSVFMGDLASWHDEGTKDYSEIMRVSEQFEDLLDNLSDDFVYDDVEVSSDGKFTPKALNFFKTAKVDDDMFTDMGLI